MKNKLNSISRLKAHGDAVIALPNKARRIPLYPFANLGVSIQNREAQLFNLVLASMDERLQVCGDIKGLRHVGSNGNLDHTMRTANEKLIRFFGALTDACIRTAVWGQTAP